MKILMISQHPWKRDNSFGNSYSNIFGKIENIEIAHIYLMDGMPDKESVVTRYYQISEKEVFRSCLKPWVKTKGAGRMVIIGDEAKKDHTHNVDETTQTKGLYSKLLGFGKRHHWSLMFLARELAWKFGKINLEGMMDFVEDFNPDLFYLPTANIFYTNRLGLYIKRHYKVPMVMDMGMDHYTLKRISYNPLFWIDRFLKRKMIRELANESEKMYVISKKLKEELEGSLGIPCEVLYKIPDKTRKTSLYTSINNPVRFLYTGNIYLNRWKSLKLLTDALKETKAGVLDIYTANPITKEIEKALNIEGVSKIHKPVSQNKVIELQNSADVLVHAEAFDKANKLLVRCAISTKIMDYMSVGRSILAIGPSDIASIEYLNDSNSAFIANNGKEVLDVVTIIKTTPEILKEYAHKGQDYIKNNLDPSELRIGLYKSMEEAINGARIQKR